MNVEGLEALKKEKLDAQIKQFMATAQEQAKEAPKEEEKPAAEESAAREVVEEK